MLERHFLSSARVIDLLVFRSALEVSRVEVFRQERELVVQPFLIVGSRPLYPLLPGAADGAECHRLITTVRPPHRIVQFLGIRQRLAVQLLRPCLGVVADAGVVKWVPLVFCRVLVRPVDPAVGIVVRDRQDSERLRLAWLVGQ